MQIESLREFIVLARFQNFSKAAKFLNYTQPTLSNHIAAMESELGFRLFHRTQPLRLTPAGQRLCIETIRITEQYDAVLDECRSLAKRDSGTLVFEQHHIRNGFMSSIMKLVFEFKKAYPNIAVQWINCPDAEMGAEVLRGNADGVFLPNSELAMTNSATKDACKTDALSLESSYKIFYLWVHKSSPLVNKDQVDVEETEGLPYLIPSGVEYAFLEHQIKLVGQARHVKLTCNYWPGDYDDCIINISPDEVMTVSEEERAQPAYDMVHDRVFVPFVGYEAILQPCVMTRSDNDNPALERFKQYLEERRANETTA